MNNCLKKFATAFIAMMFIATCALPLKAYAGDWSCSDDGHKFQDGTCSECGYVCPHSRDYTYYEALDGHHHYEHCKRCGITMDSQCVYDYNDTCTICGYHVSYGNNYNNCYAPCVPYWPSYCYSVSNEVNANRAAGTALPANVVTMNYAGMNLDLGAILATPHDTLNQNVLATTLLGSLGFTNITPSATYRLMPYNTVVPYGVQTAVTWNFTGYKYGDVVCAVYWSPTRGAQLIPVTVWPTGAATFVVPEMNGAVVTLVKCN